MSFCATYTQAPAPAITVEHPEKQLLDDPHAKAELAVDLYEALSFDPEKTEAVESRLKANKPKWQNITTAEINNVIQDMRGPRHAISTIVDTDNGRSREWRVQKGPVPL